MPRVSTSSTTLASLGGDSESATAGPRRRDHLPAQRAHPPRSRRTPPAGPALPRRAAARCTSRTPEGGSASGRHLDRPDRAAAQRRRRSPSTWSAWKWVSTTSGHPLARRADAGSRPSPPGRGRRRPPPRVPGRRAGPARRPVRRRRPPSPSRRGGQPGVGSGTSSATTITDPKASVANRRASTAPSERAASTSTEHREHADAERARRTSRPRPPAGRRPVWATAMIHAAHQAAGQRRPTRRAAPDTRPDQPAAETQHGGRADRRCGEQVGRPPPPGCTWPEIAATRGVHASWAASGTETASATQRGSQRVSRSRQPGANQRMPGRGQGREGEPGRHRQPRVEQQQEEHRGAERPGARAGDRGCPCRSAPTEPITAARSTLGSVRASSTNPSTPSTPDHDQSPGTDARPSGPAAAGSPTTSVRLVPETASRWVRPEVRKSSPSCSGIRASSPSTSAGTSARGPSGRWRDGLPDRAAQPVGAPEQRPRTARAPRAARACSARRPGPASAPAAAARGPAAVEPSASVGPAPVGDAPAPAPARRCRRPRPTTRLGPGRGRRRTARSRPRRSTGSEVTTSRASTDGATAAASASTAVCAHRLGPQQRRRRDAAPGDQPGQPAEHRASRRREPMSDVREGEHQGQRPGPRPERAGRPAPRATRQPPRTRRPEVDAPIRAAGHTVTCGARSASVFSPMPSTSSSSSTDGEGAVGGAPVEDLLRGDRPDARQGVELLGRGGVEVDQGAHRVGRGRARAGRDATGRQPAGRPGSAPRRPAPGPG